MGGVNLGKVSIRVSAAYVLVVACLATIGMLTSWGWGWGIAAANLLTLPAGTLVLGFLYFFVVVVLDLAYGLSGAFGLTLMVSAYVAAAVVNVILVLGLVTLCRELRDSRGRSRAGASGA